MAIVTCISCKRNVIPKAGDLCPSCGASTTQAAEVEVKRQDPAEIAAWNRREEERAMRATAAKKLREQGQQLVMGGILLSVLSVTITAVTYLAAANGGSYVLLTGGAIAGVAMIFRGRSSQARARALDS